MKKTNKDNAKSFFIGIGIFSVVISIIDTFSKHDMPPDFHGRWGWLHEIIYNNFGPNGENYSSILFGIFCIYYGIFKTKNTKK
jgi:hypothetical protein